MKDNNRYRGVAKLVNGEARWTNKIRLHKDMLDQPLHWKKPRMIFVDSMSDLFHKDVSDEFIHKVFETMKKCPQHTFQVLTKRTERMLLWLTDWIPNAFGEPYEPLPNVWLGTSCENRETFEERVHFLAQIKYGVKFISFEPLLGDVGNITFDLNIGSFNWAIVGGESGPNHRPMEIEWLENIVRQCHAANVPVFVKQDSGSHPGLQGRIRNDLWFKDFPNVPR